MDTLQLLQEFLARRVSNPPQSITPDMRLEDIGVDSLMLLDLMFELEDRFGVSLPDDLPRPATVSELVDIFRKLEPAAAPDA